MFPFCTVVQCPQEKMLEAIGPTLVCSAITEDKKFQRGLLDATHIDRLNIGPIPTIKLNWLQPHEGNIVDFLFRAARSSLKAHSRLSVAWCRRLACILSRRRAACTTTV